MLPQDAPYNATPLVFAAAVGATAGVLAHLLVQAGFGPPVTVGTRYVTITGIAFAIATWKLYRDRDVDAPRPPWLIRTGASLAGFAATFGVLMLLATPLALAGLAPRALPGLALALPEEITSSGTYAQGSARAALGEKAAVLVSWQTGPLPSRDDARLMAQGMSSMLPGRAKVALSELTDRTVAGQPGLSGTITGGMRGRLSWFGCDGRWVMVMTVAERPAGTSILHDRILAAARCTPEPHAPATAELTAGRTPGWYAAPAVEPGVLGAIREDGSVLVAQVRHAEKRPSQPIPAALVETMLAGAGLSVTLGAGEAAVGVDGPRTIWSARSGDSDVVAAVWFCDAPLRMVLAFGLAPLREPLPSSRDDVRALLATVRCLRAGEAPVALPALPE